MLAPTLVKNLLFLHNNVPGELTPCQKLSENAEKSEFGAYTLTNVTSCESA